MLRRRTGFTLIELLVVIAIIAVLVALLLPAVQQAREAARSSQCKNNLKQLGLAMHNYHDVNRVIPTGGYDLTTTNYPMGWVPRLMPFFDQANRVSAMNSILDNYSSMRSPYRSHNQDDPIFTNPISILSCPSSPLGERASDHPVSTNFPHANKQGALHYRACAGSVDVNYVTPAVGGREYSESGVMYPMSRVRLTDIKDGTTNTILFGETPDSFGWSSSMIGGFGGIKPWTWGFYEYGGGEFLLIDHKVIRHPIGYRGSFTTNMTPYRSAHAGGGAHFGLCDGSVRFLSNNMSLEVLKALATRNNGEVVGEF